jgi:hypothetical protein
LPARISRFLPTFLPIGSVPALLCFLALTGCWEFYRPDYRLNSGVTKHNGRYYVVAFDKTYGRSLFEWDPDTDRWIPIAKLTDSITPTPIDQYTSQMPVSWSSNPTENDDFGNDPRNRKSGGVTSRAASGYDIVVDILDEYGALYKYDSVADAYVAKLDLTQSGVPTFPQRLAVTPDGNLGFITANATQTATSPGTAYVLAVNLASFSIDSTITLPAGAVVQGVAITPDGSLAYVVTQPYSGSGPSNVYVIDVATRTIKLTIPVNSDSHLGQIAIAPDGTKAYLVDSLDTSSFLIPVIDLQSNTLDTPISIFPVTLNSQIGPSYIALHPDGTRLYFISLTGGPVRIVSLITKAVAGNIALAPGGRPSFGSQPTFTPDGIFLSFMNGPESLVWVNTLSDTVDSTIPLPPVPDGAIRNTGFFWIPGF